MYRVANHQMSVYDYMPPFHGELSAQNRWVRLAQAWDWDSFEESYRTGFCRGGKVALPARIALGGLVIAEATGASDAETVRLIRESPYLQYFLGMESFCDTAPFCARSMQQFRTRIPRRTVAKAVRLLRSFEPTSPANPETKLD